MNTPVMDLIELIDKEALDNAEYYTAGELEIFAEIKTKATELLEKERDVIIMANRAGVDMVLDKGRFITGYEYFTKTFKTQSNESNS